MSFTINSLLHSHLRLCVCSLAREGCVKCLSPYSGGEREPPGPMGSTRAVGEPGVHNPSGNPSPAVRRG